MVSKLTALALHVYNTKNGVKSLLFAKWHICYNKQKHVNDSIRKEQETEFKKRQRKK